MYISIYTYIYKYAYIYKYTYTYTYCQASCPKAYGVALVSSIDKIIGLFCNRALLKRRYSAKETYNFQSVSAKQISNSGSLLINIGWRRHIERLKLHVSFRKRAIHCGALLRKMT